MGRVSNQNNTYLRSPKLLLQFVALVQSTLQASKMFNQALTILLQLSLFSLVMAEETLTAASHGNAWKYGSGGGIVGLIVLVLDVIAFIEILKSGRPPLNKLLWCLLVFLFPIVGLIIYFFFGRTAASGGSYEPIV